jgi:hypothetical protein
MIEQLDELCEVLGVGRSELVRDILEEAIPTLGPVMAMVRQGASEKREPEWFLSSYRELMIARIRQLERLIEQEV